MRSDRLAKIMGTKEIRRTPAAKTVTVDDAMKAVKDGVEARKKK